jgi:hypothetical protein
MGLSDLTIARVDTAGQFYTESDLASVEGVIIGSGYKVPGDHAGKTWRDERGEKFEGIPEAYSMKTRLIGNWGISAVNIKTDPHSVDTVTNFTNTQTLYPDERPVAIVAQERHLERILDIIAPKIMRSPYLGLVVPELTGQPDKDGLSARLVSRWVARGLTPETPNASAIAQARVERIWNGIDCVTALKDRLTF